MCCSTEQDTQRTDFGETISRTVYGDNDVTVIAFNNQRQSRDVNVNTVAAAAAASGAGGGRDVADENTSRDERFTDLANSDSGIATAGTLYNVL